MVAGLFVLAIGIAALPLVAALLVLLRLPVAGIVAALLRVAVQLGNLKRLRAEILLSISALQLHARQDRALGVGYAQADLVAASQEVRRALDEPVPRTAAAPAPQCRGSAA